MREIDPPDWAINVAKELVYSVRGWQRYSPQFMVTQSLKWARKIADAYPNADIIQRFKPLCLYCRNGYQPQKFPNGKWGHDGVPETREYGSWPHGCKAGEALEVYLGTQK